MLRIRNIPKFKSRTRSNLPSERAIEREADILEMVLDRLSEQNFG
jgi:hypothetical protein